jgi:uncharacterized protein YndB with AHSA1/START domain
MQGGQPGTCADRVAFRLQLQKEKIMQQPTVSVSTTIAATPDKVWKALTRKEMMGAKVETDWQVGHPITFSGEWKGKPFKDMGEIQKFEQGKELSYTHWSDAARQEERPESYHLVRYELEPQGDKTRVTLSQTNMGKKTEVDEATKAEFKQTWSMMLDGLKKTAESN